MRNLKPLLINWICEHASLILMMTGIFFTIQFFHAQEQEEFSKIAKQAEIIKYKLALIMEQ
jgi:hypothetical protein